MKMEKSKSDTLITISPNTCHTSKFIQQTNATPDKTQTERQTEPSIVSKETKNKLEKAAEFERKRA